MKRKTFIIVLIVIMVLAFFGWSFADTGDGSNADIASGECGTCHWVIDGEGTLTVSAGVLDEWEDEPPWFRYSEQIILILQQTVDSHLLVFAAGSLPERIFKITYGLVAHKLHGRQILDRFDAEFRQELFACLEQSRTSGSVKITGLLYPSSVKKPRDDRI